MAPSRQFGPARLGLAPLLLVFFVAAACAPAAQSSQEATAPPSAASSAEASELPSASAPEPSADATAPSDPTGELAIGDWVETTADGLNLRESAGTGAPSQGRLRSGSVGAIAAGPVEADGYTWYAVAAPGIPMFSGCIVEPDPTILSCPAWFGWLAADDLGGNPWLVRSTPECPDEPTTVEALATPPRGLMLACFGGRTLTIHAYVGTVPPTIECNVPYSVTPAWLFMCNRSFLQARDEPAESGTQLEAHVDPSLGACGLGGRGPATCPFVAYEGQYIEVDGHFEDPVAETCELDGPPTLPFDQVQTVYRCREAFVITAIRPADGP